MKLMLTALIISTLVACTPQKNSTPGEMIDILDQNGNSKPGDGGVDVGPKGKLPRVFVLNKKSLVSIPGTHLLVSVALGWKGNLLANGIEVLHQDGSTVVINKTSLAGNPKPTLAEVKEYLKATYPERQYSDIEINGSYGVSAEITNADGQAETDIYLISEASDFVNVRMNIQHKGLVLVTAQNVLASIQLKQETGRLSLSMTRHLTLHAGEINKNVGLEFARTSMTSLNVNDASKKDGYVVEVTQLNGAADFERISTLEESITIDKEHLMSTERMEPATSVDLKLGGIYIVRTQNGPFQDIVAKVLVESIEPGKSVTLKYQTLLPVFIGILINQPTDKRK